MLHHQQAFCCPTCGGFIGEAADLSSVAKMLGNGSRRSLFEYMSKHVGAVVEREELTFALYGNRRDGGAMNSSAIVTIELGRLRSRIEDFGWTIAGLGGGRGKKATYRLIPIEAGP